ncbi:unnamed protein product [Vitrella brassicaformis CCMP3155]|uniref:Uncharacterized protein n=1 Tax=Vitrella brassicaformis (strain CCMP3155) TaxID=1169540 RepID=A0A0G4FGN1_VITBC|nr:unnamed protein product [Vitrella brassicaformis CCMP3155]|mmetsp:Transcript_36821/g.92277  ORF Transcript_36821/g.92277 Transcript_36821/m.92277 type:complete len:955 (-) Transcript_36821:193-3057(-)|eukprot:CEM12649.1 unnamed protein product [Vitrella brassicaformis CCMP3155]
MSSAAKSSAEPSEGGEEFVPPWPFGPRTQAEKEELIEKRKKLGRPGWGEHVQLKREGPPAHHGPPPQPARQRMQQLSTRLNQEIKHVKPQNVPHFLLHFMSEKYETHLGGFAHLFNADKQLERERQRVAAFFLRYGLPLEVASRFTRAGFDSMEVLMSLDRDSAVEIPAKFTGEKWLPGHYIRIQQLFDDIVSRVHDFNTELMEYDYRTRPVAVPGANRTPNRPFRPGQPYRGLPCIPEDEEVKHAYTRPPFRYPFPSRERAGRLPPLPPRLAAHPQALEIARAVGLRGIFQNAPGVIGPKDYSGQFPRLIEPEMSGRRVAMESWKEYDRMLARRLGMERVAEGPLSMTDMWGRARPRSVPPPVWYRSPFGGRPMYGYPLLGGPPSRQDTGSREFAEGQVGYPPPGWTGRERLSGFRPLRDRNVHPHSQYSVEEGYQPYRGSENRRERYRFRPQSMTPHEILEHQREREMAARSALRLQRLQQQRPEERDYSPRGLWRRVRDWVSQKVQSGIFSGGEEERRSSIEQPPPDLREEYEPPVIDAASHHVWDPQTEEFVPDHNAAWRDYMRHYTDRAFEYYYRCEREDRLDRENGGTGRRRPRLPLHRYSADEELGPEYPNYSAYNNRQAVRTRYAHQLQEEADREALYAQPFEAPPTYRRQHSRPPARRQQQRQQRQRYAPAAPQPQYTTYRLQQQHQSQYPTTAHPSAQYQQQQSRPQYMAPQQQQQQQYGPTYTTYSTQRYVPAGGQAPQQHQYIAPGAGQQGGLPQTTTRPVPRYPVGYWTSQRQQQQQQQQQPQFGVGPITYLPAPSPASPQRQINLPAGYVRPAQNQTPQYTVYPPQQQQPQPYQYQYQYEHQQQYGPSAAQYQYQQLRPQYTTTAAPAGHAAPAAPAAYPYRAPMPTYHTPTTHGGGAAGAVGQPIPAYTYQGSFPTPFTSPRPSNTTINFTQTARPSYQ